MTTLTRWLPLSLLRPTVARLLLVALAVLASAATLAACSNGGDGEVQVVVPGGCSGEMTPDEPQCPPGSACDENGDCVTRNTGYCDSDDDCPAGNVCTAYACVAAGGCDVDGDCEEGQVCRSGRCEAP